MSSESSSTQTYRIPGEPGIWVFLLGDMVIFTVCFGAFLVARAEDRELFSSSRHTLGLTIGLTNTVVLLVSSMLVVLGLGAIRVDARRVAARMFAAAAACGLLFAVLKIVEYSHLIGAGHGPEANSYYNYFFILTGMHLFHLLVGVAVLAALTAHARREVEFTGTRRVVFEAGACFWHLVDLLWMMLFPLLYLVG
ncbi:cytochrome c oxidase subunit 3 [Nocardia sp. XZ_19_231]|uniref:cytochrome c oxidase subunit 3 n=1 Tax=Nocardia sp. XZ_19_231 TaxID=2769252 RepID=UPI00188DD545|nr:cytochrome c oxidase subunit 3 [Nocardia sp. XZ_19_231]